MASRGFLKVLPDNSSDDSVLLFLPQSSQRTPRKALNFALLASFAVQ
jgi:hypothetical protein